MEISSEAAVLEKHTEVEEARYSEIIKRLKHLKEKVMADEKIIMGSGAGDMGLGGGGIMGGLLLGSLLGNRGLLGGAGAAAVEGVVTPAMLTSALSGVTDSQQNTTVLQTLGDIKASIPLAEGQVQLALSVAQSDINKTVTGGLQAIIAGQASVNKNISDAAAVVLASQNSINMNVAASATATKEAIATYGVANLTATKDAQNAVQLSIASSTKELLAALNAQNTDNLQRQLAVAENALLERNAVLRRRETEINITNNNTATATAVQAQNQQQQQFQILATLSAAVGNLANDIQSVRQTQSNINFGNQSGTRQDANASNTRVN